MSSRYGFYDCHSVANKISCFIYIFIPELKFADAVVVYNNYYYTSAIVLWHVSGIFCRTLRSYSSRSNATFVLISRIIVTNENTIYIGTDVCDIIF